MAQAPIPQPGSRSATFEAYLLDQVQAAVIATDSAGRVTHWNRHAEMVYGWVDLDQLLREVLGRVRQGLLADTATVLLEDEDGEHLVVHASEGVGGKPGPGRIPRTRRRRIRRPRGPGG